MEDMSQRADDAWSVEEIDSDEDVHEEHTARLLHNYIAWLDIYSVNAFLQSVKSNGDLTRSTAGAWVDSEDLEAHEDFSEKKHRKRKG